MRWIAFFLEILPLAVFFIGFELYGLITAAVLLILTTSVLMTVAWVRDRRIAMFPAFVLGFAVISTLLALVFDSGIFVKIETTVFNGLFGLLLLAGWFRNIPMLKQFFGAQFDLDEKTWMALSFRWGVFLGGLAIANEIAWRGLDDNGWVLIKIFVFTPLSGLFMLAQLPMTLRGRIKP